MKKQVREEVERIIKDACSNAIKKWSQDRPQLNEDGFWSTTYSYTREIASGKEISKGSFNTTREYSNTTNIYVTRSRYWILEITLDPHRLVFSAPIPLVNSYSGSIRVDIEQSTAVGLDDCSSAYVKLAPHEAKWAWHYFDEHAKDVPMGQLLAKYVDGEMQL